MTKGGSIILRVYFALVSLITLVILIFSVSDAINIGLRTYLFTQADQADIYPTYECQNWKDFPTMEIPKEDTRLTSFSKMTTEEKEAYCQRYMEQEIKRNTARKQRDAVRDIALLLVSAPLFWLHFRIVYRDWKEEKQKTA